MELIGENKINTIFNAWLKYHGFNTRVSGLDNDFYWNYDKDTVTYSFVHAERFCRDFTEVCVDLGLAYDIDIFWLSLFHEIGHGQTYDRVSDDGIWEADLLCGMDYYYCEREVIATQWAVDFINNHIEWVQELMSLVRPAIIEFFTVNNIETEDE